MGDAQHEDLISPSESISLIGKATRISIGRAMTKKIPWVDILNGPHYIIVAGLENGQKCQLLVPIINDVPCYPDGEPIPSVIWNQVFHQRMAYKIDGLDGTGNYRFLHPQGSGNN